MKRVDNVIYADFRKCRDALRDGPDSAWTLVTMAVACVLGLGVWSLLIFGLADLMKVM